MLLDAVADKEAKDNDGLTPLIQASCNGHTEVVKLLLDNNADKEAKTKYGNTPLLFASAN